MRTITIYSTRNGMNKVQSSATTWGELTVELDRSGVDYEGMKAVLGATKTTLESRESKLPEGEVKIFLMPVETKSGFEVPVSEMNYLQLRKSIQNIVANEEGASEFFNEGRNYTTKGSDDLRELLSSWIENKREPGNAEEESLESVCEEAYSSIDKVAVHLEARGDSNSAQVRDFLAATKEFFSSLSEPLDSIASCPATSISEEDELANEAAELANSMS
tara:strand:+ start:1316 stop:1972 length:657 start_codon:yes stop_codon:yes gene_type:complete